MTLPPYVDQRSNHRLVVGRLDNMVEADSATEYVPCSEHHLEYCRRVQLGELLLTKSEEVVPIRFLRFPQWVLPRPVGRHQMRKIEGTVQHTHVR